jgi:membrane-associated phospholipid phosphatase
MLTGAVRTALSGLVIAVVLAGILPSSSVLGQTNSFAGSIRPPARESNFSRLSSAVDNSGELRRFDGNQSYRVENPLSLGYARILLSDVRYILGAPLRWNSKEWSFVSMRILAIRSTGTFLDEYTRKMSKYNRGDFTNTISNTFNNFGGYYCDYVIGGFYLAGLVFKSETAKMVALDCLAATFITNEIVTPGLKNAFGRQRPYYNSGIYRFEPFSGHDSFPSGHTAIAFVNASVIASHYRQRWVKILVYGVASAVAFARINYDVHFLSDVVAGAVIGISIGRGVVHLNKDLRMTPP